MKQVYRVDGYAPDYAWTTGIHHEANGKQYVFVVDSQGCASVETASHDLDSWRDTKEEAIALEREHLAVAFQLQERRHSEAMKALEALA